MEPHEKLAIILEGKQESNTVSDICEKHDVSRDTYYRWENELKEAAEQYWSEKRPGRKPNDHFETKSEAQAAYREQKKELSEKEKEIFELKKKLEETTIQRDFFRLQLEDNADTKKN